MPSLTNFKFTKEDLTYEVKIDFDDLAVMENLMSFDVIAIVTDQNGRSHTEILRIEVDWQEHSGSIVYKDKELYRFSLHDMEVKMNFQTGEEDIMGMDGTEPVKDNVYDRIQEGIGDFVTEIIDAMPVPDPFLGCLIKASISSFIGQLLTCNELRNNYGNNGRMRQIIRCLGKHFKGIAYRTLWRAARCILRMGF